MHPVTFNGVKGLSDSELLEPLIEIVDNDMLNEWETTFINDMQTLREEDCKLTVSAEIQTRRTL